MGKEQDRPHSRLKNVYKEVDASTDKDAQKIVEVRKTDTSADGNNEFVLHEKPFDEQMNERYTDESGYQDEEAD